MPKKPIARRLKLDVKTGLLPLRGNELLIASEVDGVSGRNGRVNAGILGTAFDQLGSASGEEPI